MIIASDVEPVREFYNDTNMLLIDHRELNSLANSVINVLNTTRIRPPSSQVSVGRLNIVTCLSAWEIVAGLNVTTID